MKTRFAFLFFVLFTFRASAFEAKLNFTAIPSTSKIYFNGQLAGTGTATVTLERATLVEIRIVNEGYITFTRSYRYGKGSQFAMNEGKSGYERGKNDYTITLDKDPNYVSPEEQLKQLDLISIKTDSINNFFTFKTDKKIAIADFYKIANQVISDYFDDNEKVASDAGIKTTWQTKIIGSKKIRTRVIIKVDSENPLVYKVKIQSEYSDDVNAGAKDDEKFKEWDRLLKKYVTINADVKNKISKQ